MDTNKESHPFRCCFDNNKQPFYSLGMFAYPSGNAHMGHVRVYSIVDAIARYKRLQGYEVLNPVGWDAFGLPAENAAIANKVPPHVWTQRNIERMKTQQFGPMGWSFDWSREINTCAPDYYKWTQWIFLQLMQRKLAYKAKAMVNWCDTCSTVLANEQVVNGICWRCSQPTTKRLMTQWFIRITDYAQRLWDGLQKLPQWNKEAVAVQRNWIGRSQGAHIEFVTTDKQIPISVFTTRPDTLFGTAALVLAPEHPLLQQIVAHTNNSKLQQYVQQANRKSQVQRMASKEKTGVATGVFASQALLDHQVEIWVGDYVVADYGTGAVMCVPAHDTRDHQFAQRYHLPIQPVVAPRPGQTADADDLFTQDGVLINSGDFNGMPSAQARQAVVERLQQLGAGEGTVQFNLRDWSVSRQRYWGCPIPVVLCDSCGCVPVAAANLPVLLPSDVSFDEGRACVNPDSAQLRVDCPRCGAPAKRETDTLDTFMCSAWYAFRFADPHNSQAAFDSNIVNRCMPIDFYVGGLEHAAQHMIYFRFLTKFFHDIGLVDFDEPVRQFFCNGMVRKEGQKMSKSRGNVVVPTQVVESHSADALRLYILSDTPSELDIDWEETALHAKQKFVRRNQTLLHAYLTQHPPKNWSDAPLHEATDKELVRTFYSLMHALQHNLNSNEFHNCVARIYELSSLLLTRVQQENTQPTQSELQQAILARMVRDYLAVCSLFTPFSAEELWHTFYSDAPLATAGWPRFDKKILQQATCRYVVQVNGKKRSLIDLPVDANKHVLQQRAMQDQAVQQALVGKAVKRAIFVPNKLINFVVG
ncbi:MAG: leucine--tRNA ligase [Myxococcota bacterium]